MKFVVVNWHLKEGEIKDKAFFFLGRVDNKDHFNWKVVIRSPFMKTGTYVNPSTFKREKKTKLRKVWLFQLRKSRVLNKIKFYRQTSYDKA